MAITGTLLADFSSFQAAVQQANVSLRGMETGANKVETSLTRMVDQFSGRKIVQDAELAAQAFELLATKGIGLTNRELQRMGVVAGEAIEKLTLMGEKIPPGIQKIADAAKNIKQPIDQAQSGLDKMFTSLKSAAGVIGIAFSAQAVVGFVGKVFDAASSIKDMSDKLGISIEATQRFKYAAEQAGSTLDTVGTAIGFMNKTLAAGGGGTAQVLREVGLQFDDIRRMRPEDAFRSIAEAIKDIKDPMEQVRVVTELYGRAAVDLLPAIKAGIQTVGDQTSIMADDTVQELERAQDAWEGFFNWLTVKSAGLIVAAQKAGAEAVKALSAGAADPSGRGGGTPDVLRKAQLENAAKAMDDFRHTGDTVTQSWGKVNTTLGITVQSLEGLAAEEREVMTAIERGNAAAKQYAEAQDAAAKAGVSSYKAHQAHLKEVVKQTDAVNLATSELVHKHLEELGTRGQTILKLTADEAVRFGLDMAGLHPVVTGIGNEFEKVGTKVTAVAPKLQTFKLNLGDLSRALAELATVSGGSFGTVASGLATMVSATNTAKTGFDTLKQGFSGGFSLSGITSMASGIAGIASAAIAAIQVVKQLFKLGGPSEEELAGRELVADFHAELESMLSAAQRAEAGNEAWKMDVIAIRDAYIAAGRTAEEAEAATKRLWESSRGGSEEAKRAIEEIRGVIGDNEDATHDATAATEAQAQATIETANQAALALRELGPKIKTNEDEWRAWGAVVTAQIQAIADGIRALPLPGASPLGGGGSTRGGTAIPGDWRTQPDVTVTSNLVVSGRTLATVNAEAALGW